MATGQRCLIFSDMHRKELVGDAQKYITRHIKNLVNVHLTQGDVGSWMYSLWGIDGPGPHRDLPDVCTVTY